MSTRYAAVSTATFAALSLTLAARTPAPVQGTSAPTPAAGSYPDSASVQLDHLGMRVYDAERQGYLVVGDRFYQDAEDAEGAEHTFYQSSVKLLRLAIAADSTNASAEYHLGEVLARKSYTGFGTWDADTLKAAVEHLAQAERLAVGQYRQLLPAIRKALRDERASLDSLRH